MDPTPEEIAAMATAARLAYTPGDLSTIVHHPDGPIEVAHAPGSRVPVVTRPIAPGPTAPVTRPSSGGPVEVTTRDAVPIMLARPPEPPVSIAITPQHRRALAAERRAPQIQPDGSLPPDVQAQLEADRHAQWESSARAAYGDDTGLTPEEQAQMLQAERDAARDRVGAQLMTERPDLAYGPAAIVPPPPAAAPTRTAPAGPPTTAALDAIAASGGDMTPTDAPVEVPTRAAPRYAPGSFDDGIIGGGGPVIDGTAPMAPAAPAGRPVARRVGGGGMAAPQVATPPGLPLPAPASDAMIAGLAGPHAGPRRDADLIDRQMLVERQRAGLAARAAHTQAQIEQQAEQRRQQEEQDRQRAMAGAQRAYQNAIDRVAAAHIEPGRWFRDQGAAGTIGATIAVALGALGQAMTGSSTNSALEQINRAVDMDIDAQRSEIESGRAAADLAGNMLDITRQEFSDRQAADDAARAAMLQQAALQIQEHEAYLADDEARNNAEALRQQAEAQSQEAWRAALDQQSQMDLRAAQARRLEAQAAIDERRARGGSGGMSPQRVAQTVSAMRAAHVSEDDINRYLAQHGLSSGMGEGGGMGEIPGLVHFAPAGAELSAADVTHVRTTAGAGRQFIHALDELASIRDQVGAGAMPWDTEAIGRAAAARAQAMAAWRTVAGLGVMSDQDVARTEEFLADPTAFRYGTAERLTAARDAAERATNDALYPYGYQLGVTRLDDQDAASIAPGARRVD